MLDFGFRHYDPRHGRFISRDPIGEKGGTNLYAYAGNDPINGIDVLGLSSQTPTYVIEGGNLSGSRAGSSGANRGIEGAPRPAHPCTQRYPRCSAVE